MRRSPDVEPCSRTHRCAQIHARSSMRLFVDSWKPTSCRTSSGRFHSAGYSTQTANPLLPPGFLEHEPSTYNFSACGSKDTSAIVLPEPHYDETTSHGVDSPRVTLRSGAAGG